MLDRRHPDHDMPDPAAPDSRGAEGARLSSSGLLPAEHSSSRLSSSRLLHGVTRARRRALVAARQAWRLLVRRLSSSLTRRIALLNLVGLIAMLVGLLWLNQTRVGVIDARVQSLSAQAEIIAAAIAASVTVETNALTLDPERLLKQQAGDLPDAPAQGWSALEFSLNPETVAPVLARLVQPTRTRARVFDRDGNILLDTKAFYRRGDLSRSDEPLAADESPTLFERSWSMFKNRLGRASVPVSEELPSSRSFQEVGRALLGVNSSTVRVTTAGDTVVSAAVPVQRAGLVRGVLMLSTEEGDVDRVIAEERVSILMVFLIAASVMLVLSFLLAGTIAEPVRRLSDAADRVRRGVRTRQEIPDFSGRADEIGHLSVALRDMTTALYTRMEAIERFAADVSHELKNPLTSLRSAVETLPLARTPESRARLLDVIQHDVRRLDRLITDIADASRLDAELQRTDGAPVDLAALLDAVVGMANGRRADDDVRVGLDLALAAPPRPLAIIGHDSRLVQVFDNLIENARSFSPKGGTVRLILSHLRQSAVVQVEDDGPGIPEEALERIFERFYTDRPDQGFGQNSGLGLSICRQIVEAHGGRIRAENRRDGTGMVRGARFIVTLPLAKA